MNVEYAEAELAYTYAWWLTGSESAARTAVLAAVDRPDVPGADPELRLEILLRRVRAAAVAAPTMCPASELALLHDAIGLGLDSAAGLALIDSREARTELAHGRLEALGPESEFEIVEPQRLGGLAVGNPADVAAARQNTKLAALREAIMRGRDELVDVSRIDIPADLMEAVAGRRDHPLEVTDFFGGHTDEGTADTDTDVTTSARDQAPDARADAETADSPSTDAPAVGATVDGVVDEGPGWVTPEEEAAIGGDAGHDLDALLHSAGLDGPVPGRPMDLDDIPLVEAEPEPTEEHPRRAGSGRADDDSVHGELGQHEEIDLTQRMDDADDKAKGGARSLRWLLLVMVLLAGLAALILDPAGMRSSDQDVTDGRPTEPVVTEPAATQPGIAGPAGTDATATEPTVTASPATEPVGPGPSTPPDDQVTEPVVTFEVVRAGVAVGIGGDPDFENPAAGPFDPVSITVEYTGAEDDDALIADWSVDGVPFATERADLSPLLTTSRFTKQVPEEGWPFGQHILSLTLERTGEIVGQAQFVVQ